MLLLSDGQKIQIHFDKLGSGSTRSLQGGSIKWTEKG